MDINSETPYQKRFFSMKNLLLGTLFYACITGPVLLWFKTDADTYREIIIGDTPVYTASTKEVLPPPAAEPAVTEKAPEAPVPADAAQTGTPAGESTPAIEQDAPPMKPEASDSNTPATSDRAAGEKPAVPAAPTQPEASAAPVIDYSSHPYVPVAAPAEGLYEKNKNGQVIPVRGKDGRTPWQVYGRPVDPNSKKPRIAIIISDMGLSAISTDKAVSELPPEVTLAFVPYAENLDDWIKKARESGHETILSVPMEPETYPKDDPGPNALLTTLSADENTDRLHWALSRASGYVGIMNFMGSRFTASTEFMSGIIQDIQKRGLIVVDSASGRDSVIPTLSRVQGVPYTVNDRYIDNIASRQSIDKQLQSLEEIARRRGYAVGVAFPYPITFERLNNWFSGLKDKGIEAVPITAIVSGRAE